MLIIAIYEILSMQYGSCREPMACEPDVNLSMTAFGSLANRVILPDTSSKLAPSQAMLSTFDIYCASLEIILY